MNRWTYRTVATTPDTDDKRLYVMHRDLSDGMNNRQDGIVIGEKQAVNLTNIDLNIPGKRSRRRGSTLIGNDVGSSTVASLFNADSKLVMVEGANVRYWTGTGNWSDPIYTSVTGTDIGVVYGKESGISPDDVIIFQDGTANAQRALLDGTIQDLGDTNTSPPLTTVGCWYANRFWFLKDDLLYFSDAYDDDYSGAFDRTTNYFRVPVGAERTLVPTRDMGIVCFGKNAIWSVTPSTTPAATDSVEPVIANFGAVSKNGVKAVGDDIYFFSQDGLRSVKRTVQDKLQMGASYPISYALKTEYEEINWARISELSMEYFDNRLLISVPISTSDFKIWVYYPAYNSFTVYDGWDIRCMSTFKVSGEERLYYGVPSNGCVYRAFYGYTDQGTTTSNGTNIAMTEESRKEDFNQPFVYKNGGEIEVRAVASGNYDLSVYASFDDSSYSLIGTVNLTGSGVSFPTSFPIAFSPENVSSESFPLDAYGRWRHIQIKLYYASGSDTNDITILETSVKAFPEEYLEG